MNGLACERRGGTALCIIDRPEDQNRLTEEVLRQLTETVEWLGADDSVKAIVLTARGTEWFCGGGRLSAAPGGARSAAAFSDAMAALLEALRRCPKPVLAAVNGSVAGGGMCLAAACDLAIAGDDCRLGLPELSGGSFPLLAMAVLRQCLPEKRLYQLIYSAELLPARTLESWGFLNEVVPQAEVLPRALTWAERLAGANGAAVALGRASLAAMAGMTPEQAVAYSRGQMVTLMSCGH